eukprot:SAG25_NODE_1015_length_4296_cov_1.949964_6_plen_59_part_00
MIDLVRETGAYRAQTIASKHTRKVPNTFGPVMSDQMVMLAARWPGVNFAKHNWIIYDS